MKSLADWAMIERGKFQSPRRLHARPDQTAGTAGSNQSEPNGVPADPSRRDGGRPVPARRSAREGPAGAAVPARQPRPASVSRPAPTARERSAPMMAPARPSRRLLARPDGTPWPTCSARPVRPRPGCPLSHSVGTVDNRTNRSGTSARRRVEPHRDERTLAPSAFSPTSSAPEAFRASKPDPARGGAARGVLLSCYGASQSTKLRPGMLA
jgi:hypothetical protein